MSHSGIACGSYPADEQPSSDADSLACTLPELPMAVEEAVDIPALLTELAHVRSLDHERVNRIDQLEQALDQALACLTELRQRSQNQSILEAQLAKTEDFAYVQQQAIVSLKQQLQQQQQALLIRDQVILNVLAIAEAMAQVQSQDILIKESEPEPGISHVPEQQPQRNSADLDTPRQLMLPFDVDPEATNGQAIDSDAQLAAARQYVKTLSERVIDLEGQLKQSRMGLEEQQVLELTLRQTKALAAERNSAITALQKDLAIAQIKVEELETQLAKLLKAQAKWQYKCQEVEAERDRHHSRMTDLEQTVSEMQEQIFQQARQASELETAVQHWKDRYLASHHLMVHLKELLEQASVQSESTAETGISLNPALAELLEALQHMITTDESASLPLSTIPSPRFTPLDVPDFLIRRRTYRVR